MVNTDRKAENSAVNDKRDVCVANDGHRYCDDTADSEGDVVDQ